MNEGLGSGNRKGKVRPGPIYAGIQIYSYK
jgi:hypothetical protein